MVGVYDIWKGYTLNGELYRLDSNRSHDVALAALNLAERTSNWRKYFVFPFSIETTLIPSN